MPINFEQLGAKKEDIPLMVETLGIGDGALHGFAVFDKAAVTRIYEIAADTKAM